MKLPVIRGLIDRRILVNFRVQPAVLAGLLPSPFRPQLVGGWGMAGICLIRLRQVRPGYFPRQLGIASENAAHRIAVEWEQRGTTRQGVYVIRRDTSSHFNALSGGRLFPGRHCHARFHVREQGNDYAVALESDDRQTRVAVRGRVAASLRQESIFGSLAAASDFFRRGSLGYSVAGKPGTFDGLELNAFSWSVSPLDVDEVKSSFFDDLANFPPGSVAFDCALLMRNIEHEWHEREPICPV